MLNDAQFQRTIRAREMAFTSILHTRDHSFAIRLPSPLNLAVKLYTPSYRLSPSHISQHSLENLLLSSKPSRPDKQIVLQNGQSKSVVPRRPFPAFLFQPSPVVVPINKSSFRRRNNASCWQRASVDITLTKSLTKSRFLRARGH